MSDNNQNNEDKISEYDKLVVDLRNNITTRTSDLMSKFLNDTQESLFNSYSEADNNEDQTRFFELMNQVRTLKPAIATTFDLKFKAYLIPAKDFVAHQKQHKEEADSDELSLVGTDKMEGIVLVKGIGERSAGKYREQLSHLESRLEDLAFKSMTVFSKDALKPMNFCQAFDDALANEFDNESKKLLFSMFDTDITSKLDDLYNSVNKRLIDAGILPQIKLHMNKSRSSAPRPQSQHAPADENAESQHEDYSDGGHSGYDGGGASGGGASGGGASDSGAYGGASGGPSGSSSQGGAPAGSAGADSAGGSNISGFAMSAAPGGSYSHANQNAMQSQASEGNSTGNAHEGINQGGMNQGGPNQGDMNQGGGAQGSNTQAGAPQDSNQSNYQNPATGSGEYQHYTAGMPASQVGRVLGNYIGTPFNPETADKSSESHGESYPSSTQQHFGHQEIIQALSNIQNRPEFQQPEDGTRFDGEAIKQAVLSEIAKTSGGAVTKRINTIAEKTIDFIELIFDAIIDDDEISDAIKTLLLRLQIPIIKASMSDQEFFIYDDHPARLLLDVIADAGVGISDHTDDMYKQLDKIISNILGEHDLSTETFQQALDNLNAVIKEEENRARTKEEEEQQQLLRKHARTTVLKSLRATTTGKVLPEPVHPLILKRWPTLMFNHYLSNGKENNAWVNLVLTLRNIVESVQPLKSAEDLAKLLSEKDALLESTEEYLNSASSSKKDVQNIVKTYNDTLQSHIDDANFTEDEVTVAEETISHTEPVEEPVVVEEPSHTNTLPSNIMPGMWFQIYMGEDQVVRRCKLSVIIIEDENLMFVNHKGELVAEKSFDDFNEEMASDKTKVIMGHSAFDHAFKAVIDRLD